MNTRKAVLPILVVISIVLVLFLYQKPISLTTIEDINEASVKAGNGDARAIKFLIRNLGNKNPVLQEHAAGILGNIKSKDAVRALVNNLSSANFKHKYVLCWALGEIGDTSAIKPLLELYPKEKENVQKYILRSIAKIGKPAIPFLLADLESADFCLQKLSILALGQIGGKGLVQPLLKVASNENIKFVILALGDLAEPDGIDFLIQSLKHHDWQIRQKSAQSLTRFTDKRIVPFLEPVLNDDVVAVREWSAKAIECISGKKCKYKNEKGEFIYPDSLYH